MPNSVSVLLKRNVCFLFFICFWQTISAGSNSVASGTFVEANASQDCGWKTGWYRGYGTHTTIFPQGPYTVKTVSAGVWLRCWY